MQWERQTDPRTDIQTLWSQYYEPLPGRNNDEWKDFGGNQEPGKTQQTLKPRLHDTTGCQTEPVWQQCWTNSHCSFNRLSNRVIQPVWQPVWQPAVYTIQPVKPVVKRVWQRFDNRLYVCIHETTGCETGLTTGLTTDLTTGCIMYTNI